MNVRIRDVRHCPALAGVLPRTGSSQRGVVQVVPIVNIRHADGRDGRLNCASYAWTGITSDRLIVAIYLKRVGRNGRLIKRDDISPAAGPFHGESRDDGKRQSYMPDDVSQKLAAAV